MHGLQGAACSGCPWLWLKVVPGAETFFGRGLVWVGGLVFEFGFPFIFLKFFFGACGCVMVIISRF